MSECPFELNKDTNLWTCPDCEWVYKFKTAKPPSKNCKKPAATRRKPHKPRNKQVIIPCIYRGEKTGEVKCGTCGGPRNEPTFQCKLFNECTVRRFEENQHEPKPCIICKSRETVGEDVVASGVHPSVVNNQAVQADT